MTMIKWNRFSNFLQLEYNKDYSVVLRNWRQEEKEYNNKKKWVLTFDVEMLENEHLTDKMIFNTSGGNATRFKDIIQRAEKAGYDSIYVLMNRRPDKKLEVTDMREVKKIIKNVGERRHENLPIKPYDEE